MTQEEKQLLLKDLCARLPYGVKVFADNVELDATITGVGLKSVHLSEFHDWWDIEFIKPYLRPISSITEEEEKDFGLFQMNIFNIIFDWLNAHHFDYRGLIQKGLAIEAPEGMYETK